MATKKKAITLKGLRSIDSSVEVDLGEGVGVVYLNTPTTKQGLSFRGMSSEGDEVVEKSISLLVELVVDETGQKIFTEVEEIKELPVPIFMKMSEALANILGTDKNKGAKVENPLEQTTSADSSIA